MEQDATLDIDAHEPPVALEPIRPILDGTGWQRHAELIHSSNEQGRRVRPG